MSTHGWTKKKIKIQHGWHMLKKFYSYLSWSPTTKKFFFFLKKKTKFTWLEPKVEIPEK